MKIIRCEQVEAAAVEHGGGGRLPDAAADRPRRTRRRRSRCGSLSWRPADIRRSIRMPTSMRFSCLKAPAS